MVGDSRCIILLQLRVVARDGGRPQQQDVTVVHVHINRNLNAPKFESADYRVTILETYKLGVVFSRVEATDDDTKVN